MSACGYCGRKTSGIACYAHSDLPAIDPFFSPDIPQRKAEPTALREENTVGSNERQVSS